MSDGEGEERMKCETESEESSGNRQERKEPAAEALPPNLQTLVH